MQNKNFAWLNRTFPWLLLFPVPIFLLQGISFFLWNPYRIVIDAQPLLGYYFDRFVFLRFLILSHYLFILFLSFWISNLYFKKVTRVYLDSQKLNGKLFYWTWTFLFAVAAVVFAPSYIQTTVQLVDSSLKENQAREKATHLFQLAAGYKIQEVLELLPSPNPSVDAKDRVVHFTEKLKEVAGENLQIESIKLMHTSGPKRLYKEEIKPSQEGIVVFDAHMIGTEGRVHLRTTFQSKDGVWGPYLFTFTDSKHDLKSRFFEPLAERIASDHVRLLLDSSYQQAWDRLPASIKKGTNIEAFESSVKPQLEGLEKPVDVEVSETEIFYSTSENLHFVPIHGNVRAKNKTLSFYVGAVLDPETNAWLPSATSFR